MRKLSLSEIQAIIEVITEKELESAEILSEVYDHFLTHHENLRYRRIPRNTGRTRSSLG